MLSRKQRQRLGRRLAQGFLFLTALISLVTCPHSKVEESFPLQATHDLFYYGLGPALSQARHVWRTGSSSSGVSSSSDYSNEQQQQNEPVEVVLPYDHLQFPGVVPRSFIGPYMLALLCHGGRRLSFLFMFVVNSIYTINVDDNDLDLAHHPMLVQFLARFILMMLSLHGWYRLADAADCYHYQYQTTASSSSSTTSSSHQTTTKTAIIGNYLLLVAACQFHMPFYASRMLPNTFATIVCLHAFASWMYGNVVLAAIGLVISTAVFRCDVLLLLFVTGLIWLLYPSHPHHRPLLGLWQAIRIGVTTGVVCLVCTVPLDSLLWQRWTWPEGEVFYYNTILGKSSDWGVSVWHWYGTVAIPKSMLLTVLFVPFCILRLPERLDYWERRCYRQSRDNQASNPAASSSFIVDTEWLPFILSALGFVSLYSCLGHKEMRFLFPVMPLWNLAAAVGMSRFHSLVFATSLAENKTNKTQHQQQLHPIRTMISILGLLAAALALVLTLVASSSFVAVSRWNYPGGAALQELQDHVVTNVAAPHLNHDGVNTNDHDDTIATWLKVHVYVDVASAMTGVSLFGQRAAALSTKKQGAVWSFDKKGYESENAESVNDSSSQWSAYTHILTENPDLTNDNAATGESLFHLVATIQGHPRLDWRSGGRIVTSNAIYVLEQDDWIKKNRIIMSGSSTTTEGDHHDHHQEELEHLAEASSTSARIEL